MNNNVVLTPNFNIENRYSGIVAGIDEAGRGPLAGPVIACCAILDRKKYPKNINDSKKITEKNRESIFNDLMELEEKNLFKYGLGIIEPDIIDKINIRNATKLAMKNSYEDLISKYNIKGDMVIVDGNFVPEIQAKSEYVIKGDSKSLTIASASIIAKVTRDNIMCQLGERYPEYLWYKNKGYGTKQHREAIEKHGITKYHRKSFIHIQLNLF